MNILLRLKGEQETYYFPTEPWYVPGINSPPFWRLYGMPPPNQWPTREHERFHKYYIDRVFPPMFWNYAWINWMPRTKGWWLAKKQYPMMKTSKEMTLQMLTLSQYMFCNDNLKNNVMHV
ncbi:hypothetical protein D917_06102 [Trichinella nativa]|uniref:Uncharacterized protein n=1 Tax=Trichinella nativa TaxID=6335 RepID=A0A1Y3EUB4_9BILA|nr:hypothetical protein D917_06102 [Trichinella nativa]